MAGPYQILNEPSTPWTITTPATGTVTGTCPEFSVSFTATSSTLVKGGQTSASTYAAFTCSPSNPVLCALYKNAEKNGNAAVRDWRSHSAPARAFLSPPPSSFYSARAFLSPLSLHFLITRTLNHSLFVITDYIWLCP